jgi:hypothetical protein
VKNLAARKTIVIPSEARNLDLPGTNLSITVC